MASSITVSELQRRLASSQPPRVVDVRRRQFHAASPHAIAGASWHDPADVARMALWLASDEARRCSGQTFIIDGGVV